MHSDHYELELQCKNCREVFSGYECKDCGGPMEVKPEDTQAATSTPLPEQGGDTPISDKEAWLRIFEAIRPAVNSTDFATNNTNEAFDAMKKKLEDTHGTK